MTPQIRWLWEGGGWGTEAKAPLREHPSRKYNFHGAKYRVAWQTSRRSAPTAQRSKRSKAKQRAKHNREHKRYNAKQT